MELPYELRCAIEKKTVGLKQGEIKKIAQELSERYINQSGAGKKLLTKNEEAVVYSVVRMPATYGAVYSALSYAVEMSEIQLNSLLDVGAGTGTASWAASELLDLDTVTCLEREDAMRQLGQEYMKEGCRCLQEAVWQKKDVVMSTIDCKADLVISSYMLNELSLETRIKVVDQLWKATGKMLLIIEPGTPVGYEELKEIREHLLKEGAHIAAPCPKEGNCPLNENDWCHFSCRIARSKLHRVLKGGEAPYEDEKYTYMAFTKEESSHAQSRILRHPMIEKGEVTLEVCAADEYKKVKVKKKDGELFKKAHKAKCGDAWND